HTFNVSERVVASSSQEQVVAAIAGQEVSASTATKRVVPADSSQMIYKSGADHVQALDVAEVNLIPRKVVIISVSDYRIQRGEADRTGARGPIHAEQVIP